MGRVSASASKKNAGRPDSPVRSRRTNGAGRRLDADGSCRGLRAVPARHDDSTRVDSEAAPKVANVPACRRRTSSVSRSGPRAPGLVVEHREAMMNSAVVRRRGSPGSAGCRAPVAAGSCRATPTDRAAAERCRGTRFGERNSAWRRALIAVSASCPSGNRTRCGRRRGQCGYDRDR
jgi:hypothetical protein